MLALGKVSSVSFSFSVLFSDVIVRCYFYFGFAKQMKQKWDYIMFLKTEMIYKVFSVSQETGFGNNSVVLNLCTTLRGGT